MEDLKITKGEWRIGDNLPNLIFAPNIEQSIVIAQWDGTVVTQEEAIANAKLIASAPDLLEALQDLVNANIDNKGESVMSKIDKAKKAIKKATE